MRKKKNFKFHCKSVSQVQESALQDDTVLFQPLTGNQICPDFLFILTFL
jgi:hypothetical protein